MSKILCLIAILICTPEMAGDLWVPTLHTITIDGKYQKKPLPSAEPPFIHSKKQVRDLRQDRQTLNSMENGVSLVECEMRLDEWNSYLVELFDMRMRYWGPKGKYTAFRTSCEPVVPVAP